MRRDERGFVIWDPTMGHALEDFRFNATTGEWEFHPDEDENWGEAAESPGREFTFEAWGGGRVPNPHLTDDGPNRFVKEFNKPVHADFTHDVLEIHGKIRRAMYHAVSRTTTRMLWRARFLSSGTLTYKEMLEFRRLFDHGIYSRADPAYRAMPGNTPAVISVHTGEFLSGWNRKSTRMAGDSIVGGIYNNSWKAPFMQETIFMVRRPIDAILEAEAHTILAGEISKGLARINKQHGNNP